MSKYNDDVMVALLPVETQWCKLPLPHLTIVYAGLITNIQPYEKNELLKAALMVAKTTRPIELNVLSLTVFGDFDVLTVDQTPTATQIRTTFSPWNASDFRDWKPHVSAGPAGSFSGTMPHKLHFDRILVAWGDDHTVYPLQGV